MIASNPHPGRDSFSPARRLGDFLVAYLRRHPDFYLFSPDETTSNKLDALYDVTARAWDLPRAPFDLPEAGSGHIIEMLSENTLFACMTGHLISGSPAAMTSYEAFFSIITSQILQHLKFLQQSQSVSWRPAYPSANLLSTSTCWRQDHNGFTHQSPALISTLLALPSNLTNCLFPIDDLAAEAAAIYAFNSRLTASTSSPSTKPTSPAGSPPPAADAQFFHGGASIVDFAPADPPITPSPAAKPASSNTSPSDHPDYPSSPPPATSSPPKPSAPSPSSAVTSPTNASASSTSPPSPITPLAPPTASSPPPSSAASSPRIAPSSLTSTATPPPPSPTSSPNTPPPHPPPRPTALRTRAALPPPLRCSASTTPPAITSPLTSPALNIAKTSSKNTSTLSPATAPTPTSTV